MTKLVEIPAIPLFTPHDDAFEAFRNTSFIISLLL